MGSHAREATPDPRIGMVLQDRYRIVRKLGDGGMGSVYEGEHIKIRRRVAIKVLHSQFAQKPEIVARFQREAEAATSIGHPNIIEVTDMGEFPDGTAYMVLEYLDGRDWARDIATQGPQPLGKVVHVITQVCDALEAAHAKGIVHRDLKPENVFLIERGGDPSFVKVLDFGISKIADASGEDRSLTQTGTALGTPYYMAPEQCQGKKDVDARADIYSLGVILFQALTAQYPFDDESYPMLVLKICTEAPPPLQQYRPDVPFEVVQIVNRMLSKLRENRFQSCAEVRAALAPFRGMWDAPVVASDAPKTSARGPSVLERAASPDTYAPAMTPSGTAYLPGTPAPGSIPQASAPPSSSRGPMLAVLAGLGLLILAGVVVGGTFAFSGRLFPEPVAETTPIEAPPEPVPEPEATPEDEPAAAATPAELAAPTTPTAPVVAAPTGFAVNVTATPTEATIEIDGEARSNPFDGELSPGTHHLVVRAPGHVTVDREVEITGVRPIAIALERERRVARVTSPTPTTLPPTTRSTGFEPRRVPSGSSGSAGTSQRNGPLIRDDGLFGR